MSSPKSVIACIVSIPTPDHCEFWQMHILNPGRVTSEDTNAPNRCT